MFLGLLVVQIILMAALPEIGWSSLQNIRSNVREMFGVIPPIFVLLGLSDVWVDRKTMMKYTGTGSGIRGALISFLSALRLPGHCMPLFPLPP